MWKQKTVEASIEVDSKLGTYYRVNSHLQKFTPNTANLTENERILITRYRTGSQSLAIEIGRFSNTPRANRLCVCGDGVQTVWHIFPECQLTRTIVHKNYQSLHEVLDDRNLLSLLFLITKVLKIPSFWRCVIVSTAKCTLLGNSLGDGGRRGV